MVDHFADSTQNYRTIIEQVGKSKLPITEEAVIDGFNSWEIAMELGSFTLKWLSKDIYDNRSNLCGGEESNAFEPWRNLHVQYSGLDSLPVQVGGFKAKIRSSLDSVALTPTHITSALEADIKRAAQRCFLLW